MLIVTREDAYRRWVTQKVHHVQTVTIQTYMALKQCAVTLLHPSFLSGTAGDRASSDVHVRILCSGLIHKNLSTTVPVVNTK